MRDDAGFAGSPFLCEAGVMPADSEGVGSAPPKIPAEEEGFLAEVSPRAGFCKGSGGDFRFPAGADADDFPKLPFSKGDFPAEDVYPFPKGKFQQ